LNKYLLVMISVVFVVGRATGEEEPSTKSGFTRTAQFSGRGSVTAQLQEDDEIKESVLRLSWFDAALNPEEDRIWIGGVRVRVTL